MYMQDVLQTLNRFWVDKGCILAQPYHTEVGAGTSNPSTFLRVLGPEPWWVGYVEPSIRPADGRYGENPNRLQHYHQYQVILKPSPWDVQELFLQSLEALGLDLSLHDFRFVEDNWESPSLGAWGLGWEAWLDGMEILQFTYFQECGGLKLDVRACELTYGIERIVMYLQGKDNVYDIEWAPQGITYGDIFHAGEVEFCKYNFEHADTDKLFQIFHLWEEEALRLIELGLVMPAYDHCLRLSHLFNVLDARSALSVTERGRFLLRCRTVAERCAHAFRDQREEMGFPLRRFEKPRVTQTEALPEPPLDSLNETDTLLIEIGVEELPHRDIQEILLQAPPIIDKTLADLGIEHGPTQLWITPRRIALRVDTMPARQPDEVREARGPRKNAAVDENGEWTTPARKFAEAQGARPEDIYFVTHGKAEYCFVKVHVPGQPVSAMAQRLITALLEGLRFQKSMGWEDSTVTFSRPVRWLLALHGSHALPVAWRLREASDIGPERCLHGGAVTYGHRRLAPGAVTVPDADSYGDVLRDRQVMVDREERMEALRAGIRECSETAGLQVTPEDEADLFEELCDLVEWPEPLVCEIPEDALVLPEEIIITPMKEHQRYAPLRYASGGLSRKFIAVANGRHDEEARRLIREGNERVLNARLRDARYFWDTDTKHSLETFAKRLDTILFHQKLGSMADKVERMRALHTRVKDHLPAVDDEAMTQVLRLMKADLATQMVFEFDSLEGVVGMLYARKEGLPEEIARALFEHRLPRKSGDDLPEGILGLVAGIVDRLDTLAGYFAIGVRVKGASDPFGLRRNALALLALLRRAEVDVDLEALTDAAIANYADLAKDPEQTRKDLLQFLRDRMAVAAREEGYSHDLIAAALHVHFPRPQRFRRCLEALSALGHETVQDLAEQSKRMQRIVKEPADEVNESLLEDSERPLYALVHERREKVTALVEAGELAEALTEAAEWTPAISAYFEAVLVNSEDAQLRANRHALLRDVLRALQLVADFTQIEKTS
ncbi:MAG: glycine--tRNA ligase subunit beta [Candidatus Hydrogenedentota bacterium]